MENYIVINGKKAELTDEQLEKLGIKIEKDIFNPEEGEHFYYVDGGGTMIRSTHGYSNDFPLFSTLKEAGNCCTDKDIMQQRAWHETLSRLLWRFSMQNGGRNLDWKDKDQKKYFIRYYHNPNSFWLDYYFQVNSGNEIYFISEEIGKEAINTIVKPFIETHPGFVW